MDIDWRERVEALFGPGSKQVDLDRVVISADTSARILRYLFPGPGAKTLALEHDGVNS
jgi:hypothetical protein